MDSKLEAIAHLKAAFIHNAAFKKAWEQYIELSVIEAIENHLSIVPDNKKISIAKDTARQVLNLFDPFFWDKKY